MFNPFSIFDSDFSVIQLDGRRSIAARIKPCRVGGFISVKSFLCCLMIPPILVITGMSAGLVGLSRLLDVMFL